MIFCARGQYAASPVRLIGSYVHVQYSMQHSPVSSYLKTLLSHSY